MNSISNLIARVEYAIQRFEVGEPLRTLVEPRFSTYGYTENLANLRLVIQSIEAYKGDPTPVCSEEFIAEYMEDAQIFETMRNMLKKVLAHEVDESILIQGVRVYDPHK